MYLCVYASTGYVEMTGLLSYSCPEALNVEGIYMSIYIYLSIYITIKHRKYLSIYIYIY
jgi:hypothetical protein